VLADRLAAKMKEANAIKEAERKLSFVRNEVLPLRLEIARSYESLIAAFVNCAKSPGEMGTIASIESGCRERVVFAQDKAIAQILGEALPAEAAVSTDYRGAPRIFVPAARTQMSAGEQQEIRAFVLSGAKCTGMSLYWRSLGEGRFEKLVATHRARQAYRAALPAPSQARWNTIWKRSSRMDRSFGGRPRRPPSIRRSLSGDSAELPGRLSARRPKIVADSR
jgi:hypothetical protein